MRLGWFITAGASPCIWLPVVLVVRFTAVAIRKSDKIIRVLLLSLRMTDFSGQWEQAARHGRGSSISYFSTAATYDKTGSISG
jgi:hypothetical protein